MKDKLNNWINVLHILLILLPAIQIFFDVNNQKWIALIPIGLIILIQCLQYVSAYDLQDSDSKDISIYYLYIGKVILFTLYLIMTGYWFFCPLYYVIIYPRKKYKINVSLLLVALGLLLIWFPRLKYMNQLPWFFLSIIVVLSITIILHGMEVVVRQIIRREHILEDQMKATSLNELKVLNLNRELAMKYQLADTNARLEERENISRNIHNVVGHTITSAIVSLQAYKVLKDLEPQKAKEKLLAATERMHLSLEEIRRAVRVLDQETQDICLKDFAQLLITELKRFSMDTEIEVSHNLEHLDMDQSIDKRYCEFLHSSLTECLTNGIRHGHATSFYVFIQCDLNHIGLSVTDNGTGFGNLSKEEQERRIRQGYGIRKMDQFVLEHGGKMKINSDSGFNIHIELPLL